jgi:hypothetical protein
VRLDGLLRSRVALTSSQRESLHLPATIRLHEHQHILKLRSIPDYTPGMVYFCDLCERTEDYHDSTLVYHCDRCDFGAHLECAQPHLVPSLFISSSTSREAQLPAEHRRVLPRVNECHLGDGPHWLSFMYRVTMPLLHSLIIQDDSFAMTQRTIPASVLPLINKDRPGTITTMVDEYVDLSFLAASPLLRSLSIIGSRNAMHRNTLDTVPPLPLRSLQSLQYLDTQGVASGYIQQIIAAASGNGRLTRISVCDHMDVFGDAKEAKPIIPQLFELIPLVLPLSSLQYVGRVKDERDMRAILMHCPRLLQLDIGAQPLSVWQSLRNWMKQYPQYVSVSTIRSHDVIIDGSVTTATTTATATTASSSPVANTNAIA